LSQVDLKSVITLLKQHTAEEQKPLKVTLIGGLALHYYGMEERSTFDVDAEIVGDLEALFHFLKASNIPADLSENISGWSVIAMPPGYRDRTVKIHQSGQLEVQVLDPKDFVIAKLRRFTEEDIGDALFVVKKYQIKPEEIALSAEAATQHSVKDTMLFLFKKNVEIFQNKVEEMGHSEDS
jgi:hypothetical protein